MDWLAQQADWCCGGWIMLIPLPVLAAMVLGPGLLLLILVLYRVLRR